MKLRNGNGAWSQSRVLSITLYCLSYLQIFIDHYALLTYDRGSYEQPKTVNRIEIDQLESEL